MIILSKPGPHASTGIFSPKRGTTTSGLKIPAPPNSSQTFFPGCQKSISTLGSVYGKYPGRKRTFSNPIFAKNTFKYPSKCLKFTFLSATIPSVWLNSKPWLQSTVSFLKHFPIAKNFAGSSLESKAASVWEERHVVCVHKTSFFASSSSHL